MLKPTHRALRIEIATGLVALAIGILASIVLGNAGAWFSREFDDAAPVLHSFAWRFLATFLLVAFGVSIYAFRRWNRTLYGIAELATGVFAVWNIVGELSERSNTGVWLTVLTGSGFLLIRGCDNIQQGIDTRRKQPDAEV
jgi:ABC-type dipeptide/oligopeptide/nickel transport system permease subunit